jgi:hypothetical protein
MFSTITGRADLEVSIPGDGAFAATALPLVAETPHVVAAAGACAAPARCTPTNNA